MAQEPYFEKSDQSFKSNNTTLKNPTNIFWEKSTAKLAMPASHSTLLSLSSGKLVSYNAGEKNDEKMGNQSRNKKRNAKGNRNRKRVTWFLLISRKYTLSVANLIFTELCTRWRKRVQKKDLAVKKWGFFFATSWQSPRNWFSASLRVNRLVHKDILTDVRVWNCT